MNVENLAGNQYLNFVIVALTELPSVFIGEFLISRFGRRWMHVLCMAVTMLLYIVICIVIESAEGKRYMVVLQWFANSINVVSYLQIQNPLDRR